jgi:hypothetical protein
MPNSQPRAAHCFTPLTFGQADDEPPGSVQNRERAEHDKKKGGVHVWINIVGGDRPSTRSTTRRAGDKNIPSYSITSSARARIDCGIVRPSARAVFRLITTSNFGRQIGRVDPFEDPVDITRKVAPKDPMGVWLATRAFGE